MFKHWYELTTIDKLQTINFNQTDEFITKITIDNFKHHIDLIQSSIDKFNSEIDWDDMWTLDDAKQRLVNNQILYILQKNNISIGHVWYLNNYLYNAYVSKERPNDSSHWFICETIIDVLNNGYDKIELYTDYWNQRAINFWKKLGFVMIKKN